MKLKPLGDRLIVQAIEEEQHSRLSRRKASGAFSSLVQTRVTSLNSFHCTPPVNP